MNTARIDHLSGFADLRFQSIIKAQYRRRSSVRSWVYNTPQNFNCSVRLHRDFCVLVYTSGRTQAVK